ncbi:MAG: hypothetical protein JO296_20435 [Pseudonocardiales bacterium]|nr:hypothetical protein [Pseudonocardiales bacterium]
MASLRSNWVVAADCDVRALAVVTISQLGYGLIPPLAIAVGLRRQSTSLLRAGGLGWAAHAFAHARMAQRLGQPAASGVLAPFSWAAIGCLVGDAARIVMSGTTCWRGRPVITARRDSP